MKIKAVLGANGYKSKDGTYPIYLRVYENGKRSMHPVGVKVLKDDWDPRTMRVKNSRINAQEINLKILELLGSIEKNAMAGLGAQVGNRDDLFWWFDDRVEYSRKMHGTYNYEKLRSLRDILKEFCPVLPLTRLDHKLILDFEKYLAEKRGNSLNSIADKMKRLKMIIGIIIKSGHIPMHKNPFNGYVAKRTKVQRERVNFDFIQQLAGLKLSRLSNKQLSIDMYLYSFFNAGIRFGDLARLKVGDVHNGRLRYQMHKSTVDRNIKQVDIALKIWKRHAKGKRVEQRLFDTGVEWRTKNVPEQIYAEDISIKRRNALFNKYLKQVCRELGHPEVSFHSARNSFADFGKSKNMDIHTLKDLLGHSKVTTTEMYMRSFYEEESDAAMDKLFGPGLVGKVPPDQENNNQQK